MRTTTRMAVVLAGIAGLGLAAPSYAVTIGGTDVGSVDLLRCAIKSANSGEPYEKAQLEACVGGSLTLVGNINVSGSPIADGDYRGIDVSPNGPGFFLLKFGTGNEGNDMFFFENLSDLNWLVWQDSVLIANGLPGGHVQSLSHYNYTTTTSTSSGDTSTSGTVPESASTLTLLGLGLLGLGFARRRVGRH